MNLGDFDPEKFEPCDQCALRSYVWASLPSGRVLSFCGHHYSENENALKNQNAYILDRRDLI